MIHQSDKERCWCVSLIEQLCYVISSNTL